MEGRFAWRPRWREGLRDAYDGGQVCLSRDAHDGGQVCVSRDAHDGAQVDEGGLGKVLKKGLVCMPP